MTSRVNSITRNYNNEPLKPGEVLVPTMYDAAFAKAHCTNPDCIKTISAAGRNFKVMYVAVPESVAKAARNSFNLTMNEQLGHYTVPNSVSIDQMADNYDLDLATVPSPEDMMIEHENKAETAAMFAELVHPETRFRRTASAHRCQRRRVPRKNASRTRCSEHRPQAVC